MRSYQCARALAALLVIYYHAVLQISHISGEPAGSTSVPLFGKSGVDVFFVLSGLLIWSSTQTGAQDVLAFYWKRLLRIVPLYWLLTVVVAAISVVVPSALRSTRFEPAHLIASLLFVPWPNPASNGSPQDLMTPPIVPGWTLNFEVFFYLVFGICLFVPVRLRLSCAILLFGLLMGLSWLFEGDSLIVGFYDPGLILEFVIGLCLGYALERGASVPSASAWLLAAAALDLLILLDWDGGGFHRLYTSGLPAGLLLFSLAVLERGQRWPRLDWLVALGDATYSLYLTHIFILAGLRMALNRLGATLETPSTQIAFIGIALGACIAAGLLTYHHIERRLGRAIRNLGLARRGRSAGAALAGGAARR